MVEHFNHIALLSIHNITQILDLNIPNTLMANLVFFLNDLRTGSQLIWWKLLWDIDIDVCCEFLHIAFLVSPNAFRRCQIGDLLLFYVFFVLLNLFLELGDEIDDQFSIDTLEPGSEFIKRSPLRTQKS